MLNHLLEKLEPKPAIYKVIFKNYLSASTDLH